MATPEEFLDFDELAFEHIRLERRKLELARQLERTKHRASAFPSEFGAREVRKLERERQTVHDRLAELSGLLLLVPLRHR